MPPGAFSGTPETARVGTDMQNQQRHCRGRGDLSDLVSRIRARVASFVTVHTFGGRGSPSF
jgi:hypothetical protein